MCSNQLTNLDAIVKHNWDDLYDYLNTQRILALTMKRIFIKASKIKRKLATEWHFGLANHLTLIACCISYEWMQRKLSIQDLLTFADLDWIRGGTLSPKESSLLLQ